MKSTHAILIIDIFLAQVGIVFNKLFRWMQPSTYFLQVMDVHGLQ